VEWDAALYRGGVGVGGVCGVQQWPVQFEEDLAKVIWRATEPARGWLMQCRCGAGECVDRTEWCNETLCKIPKTKNQYTFYLLTTALNAC
jgi:hypothetical protein